MKGYQQIGLRNWLLLAFFLISSASIFILWPNKGFGWISFVFCAFLIGTTNFLSLISNRASLNSKVFSFLFFRVGWSFGFTFYIVGIESGLIPSVGLGIILIFMIFVFFDLLIVSYSHEILQSLGAGFIPKFS